MRPAARCGRATAGGTLGLVAVAMLALGVGCADPARRLPGTGREPGAAVPAATGVAIHTAEPPSADERYCAWYGTPGGDGVLYLGQAAFWSAMKSAGGDPGADLERPGPQQVGRFDLAGERWLPPLPVGRGGERSGVWDVLPGADGRIFFTTFYEAAGAVDPATGRVEHFEALGRGLNELAPGPDDRILVTRYGSGEERGDGELIAVAIDGSLVRRWSLVPPAGFRMAPKTPAWDAARGALWVTTDLLPEVPDAANRHDAWVLDPDGRVVDVVEEREVQFAAGDGRGGLLLAEVAGRELSLRVRGPTAGAPETRRVLDRAFPVELDFVQDVQPSPDGRVVVTRWSGIVHVLHPDGRLAATRLPSLGGLYYTGVLQGDRLCVTHCGDVTVVCADAP